MEHLLGNWSRDEWVIDYIN